MVSNPDLLSEVSLDTSYAIALASPRDQYHLHASQLATRLEAASARITTTRSVMLEIGNALARQRYRRGAFELLESPERDPDVEIVPLSESLYASAYRLFRDRPDKDWGLTDCVSFTLMDDRGLSAALTADVHFRPAGFRPLLLEQDVTI